MQSIVDGGAIGTNNPLWQARVFLNQAMSVGQRPLDYLYPDGTPGGFYRVAGLSGALTRVTGGTGGDVFSLRWTDTTKLCVIHKLLWWFVPTVAFGTEQEVTHVLYIARAFTAADSAGTDITPAAGQQMKRTSMADSLMSKIWIAGTGAITAGTRTLDTQPIAARSQWVSGVGIGLAPYEAINFDNRDEYPVVLAANEGLVLQNVTTMGASGTILLGVDVAWSEIDPAVIL